MSLTDAERAALQEVSFRYASAVDGRRFEEIAELFTIDAVLITPARRLEGRGAINEAMGALVRYDATYHLVGQTLHWRSEDGVVRGETYCVAHHFSTEPGLTRDRVMYIRYHDELVRTDSWRLARRELDVVWTGQEDKPGPT